MKMLHKEKEMCQREGRKYRGLTYAKTRRIFQIEYGYVPTIGNRYRELRKLGWVNIQKEDDGLNHVYPIEKHVNHWET